MDEIAISGISGRVAQSRNLEEFKNALLDGIDLVNHQHKRWNCEFLKTPTSIGVLSGLEDFDAGFFCINPKQADQLDPRTRQLVEVTFESILDAGINPQDLRGTNTAVILAVAENTNEGLMDRSLAIMANTISFYLDLKGPSYALDTGCSSSVYALNQAVEAVSFGSCDNVLVCSAQTHLLPTDSIQLNKLGVLSKDGKCKTFDDDRNGYVKSEAVVSIFLQKQKDAKRIYATIAGIGCNVDGFKEEGITNPATDSQLNLLRMIYEKFNIDPNDVEYIDAHGTGTLVGDIKECSAIAEFFVKKGRLHRLKIGSVKTNTGHCENAAGLVSLLKLLISVNCSSIPANLNFQTPALDIPCIDNNHIEVVSKQTEYKGGLLALSSFGIGGANGHLVIRPYLKNGAEPTTPESTPRLVIVSGRTQKAVETLFEKVEENRNDLGFLTLLDGIFDKTIKNHPYKGYKILQTGSQKLEKAAGNKPIWFSYSGMGSQWPGMAKDLMQFDIFRTAIEKCSAVLKPYGMDLVDVVVNGTEETFDDPENCFPAIIAISVGLTDILYSLGIEPDGIIGHSLGEIGCAYGDGLISAEQAVQMAHARGLATKKTQLISGLMASIGLSLKECEDILPKDIFLACDNYDKNVTISGPTESVENFVNDLKSNGVFARIVNTAGIAFHSKYIHDAGPFLLEMLNKIIPDPKRRSKRWLASAIPEKDYDSYLGHFSSAEYHHHNFMSRVLFNQVLKKVPEDAVLVEIAPRGLFQAIFRRALSPNITNLCLVNKDINNNMEFLLSSIGKLYLSTNISICLKALNKMAHLPVNGKTPILSSMFQWDHSSKWQVPKYDHNKFQGEKIVLNLRSLEYKSLFSHLVNGSPVFPSTGFLFLAWNALANKHEKDMATFPVVLKNVRLLRAVICKEVLEFHVNVLRSNHFEIIEQGDVVATGKISPLREALKPLISDNKVDEPTITSEDIYREFHLRGYDYLDVYASLIDLGVSGTSGTIKWNKNWISFMDAIIQAMTFHKYSDLVVPTTLSQINIDPVEHIKLVQHGKNVLEYFYDKLSGTARCGGVEIIGLDSTRMRQKIKHQKPVLKHYDLVQNDVEYQGQNISHFNHSLSIALQIVIENNTRSLTTHIVELRNQEQSLKETVIGLVHPKYLKHIKFSQVKKLKDARSTINLLIISCDDYQESRHIYEEVSETTFIFLKTEMSFANGLTENVIFRCYKGGTSFVLLRKPIEPPENFCVIQIDTKNFKWIETVKEHLDKNDFKVYLLSTTLTTGLIGFFNCIKEELQANNLRLFIVNVTYAFDVNSDFYAEQVKKDLTINIFDRRCWCTYRMMQADRPSVRKISNCYLKFDHHNLEWVEANPYEAKYHAHIKYASLNHLDANKFQEKNCAELDNGCLGIGYSGVNNSGQNIMGLSLEGCLGTSSNPRLTWKLPDHLTISLEEASTIPFDYTIAFQALFIKGRLKAKENVLINGTDTTCLAAIYFALDRKSNVFVGVRNSEEISKVNGFFSDQGKINFVYVNDVNRMHSAIPTEINLMFLSNENNLDISHMDFLAPDSKLITINHNNFKIDGTILNALTLKECQLHRINIKNILRQNDVVLNLLQSSIQNYLNRNSLRSFKYVARNSADISGITEYLLSESDTKLVVHIEKETIAQETVKRRLYFDSSKSYVVVGGLGGVGLELSKWLLAKGATKIVMNSRSPVTSPYVKYLLKKWTDKGNIVITNQFDCRTLEGALKLAKEATNLAPIGGIFNLAMVLRDKLFSDLTPSDFHEVVAPKLHIAQNLDHISRKVCPKLEHFVVFSAITALGNQGQSNYGFANSAIEMLCKERTSARLPALAVQWGCIGDVGFVARQNIKKGLVKESPQGIYSCLNILEQFMLKDMDVVSSTLYESSSSLNSDDFTQKNSILSHIASILGVTRETDLDANVPMVNLGVDSISSLEIRNLLLDELGVELTSAEVRKLTLEKIGKMGRVET